MGLFGDKKEDQSGSKKEAFDKAAHKGIGKVINFTDEMKNAAISAKVSDAVDEKIKSWTTIASGVGCVAAICFTIGIVLAAIVEITNIFSFQYWFRLIVGAALLLLVVLYELPHLYEKFISSNEKFGDAQNTITSYIHNVQTRGFVYIILAIIEFILLHSFFSISGLGLTLIIVTGGLYIYIFRVLGNSKIPQVEEA